MSDRDVYVFMAYGIPFYYPTEQLGDMFDGSGVASLVISGKSPLSLLKFIWGTRPFGTSTVAALMIGVCVIFNLLFDLASFLMMRNILDPYIPSDKEEEVDGLDVAQKNHGFVYSAEINYRTKSLDWKSPMSYVTLIFNIGLIVLAIVTPFWFLVDLILYSHALFFLVTAYEMGRPDSNEFVAPDYFKLRDHWYSNQRYCTDTTEI